MLTRGVRGATYCPVAAHVQAWRRLSRADARGRLSALVGEAAAAHERFKIVSNGRRAAILPPADDYDSLEDTVTELADAEMFTGHNESRASRSVATRSKPICWPRRERRRHCHRV